MNQRESDNPSEKSTEGMLLSLLVSVSLAGFAFANYKQIAGHFIIGLL